MNLFFPLTLFGAFLAVGGESALLILQLRGRKLQKWFGRWAFPLHATITLILWFLTFIFYFLMQLADSPPFHNNLVVRCLGLVLLVFGLVLATWGFLVLGLKRSLCLNFFEEDVPVVQEHYLFHYIREPEDYGLWMVLFGLALVTGSTYNLFVAFTFVALMLPHQWLENRPLQ